jgi:hypothetical protein
VIGGKPFFFEKKNQKTFAPVANPVVGVIETRFSTLAGLAPAIHAVVQASALEAAMKCRAIIEQAASGHRTDGRVKPGQGELGEAVTPQVDAHRRANRLLRHPPGHPARSKVADGARAYPPYKSRFYLQRTKVFCFFFSRKKALLP